MTMQISNSTVGDKVIIKLSGRFDFNDHRIIKGAYEPAIQQAEVKKLEVDLADIEYLDSSALGMLMLMRERVLAAGKTVVLSNPSKTVSQILDIANFGKLFTIL